MSFAYGSADPVWVFTADPATNFYSRGPSDADRQPNGTTLMCEGTTGKFWKTDPSNNLV